MTLTAKSSHRRGAIEFNAGFLRRRLYVNRVFRAMEFEEDFRINTKTLGVVRVFGYSPHFDTHYPGEPTPLYEIIVRGKGSAVDSVQVKRAESEAA